MSFNSLTALWRRQVDSIVAKLHLTQNLSAWTSMICHVDSPLSAVTARDREVVILLSITTCKISHRLIIVIICVWPLLICVVRRVCHILLVSVCILSIEVGRRTNQSLVINELFPRNLVNQENQSQAVNLERVVNHLHLSCPISWLMSSTMYQSE